MIVEKGLHSLSELAHGDAPPAYEASVSPVPSASVPARKRAAPILCATKPSPATRSWFTVPSPASRVRSTVLALVRDLVKRHQPDIAIDILKSCAEACAANGLSISVMLQDKSVEGHTPLYWAIIMRPMEPTEKEAQDIDFLTALLALSSPVTPATISDIRLACLLMSDQTLFQQLRASPGFASLSATDEMVLDATMPPDDILVEDVAGDACAFTVDFAIMRFHKRMRVSNTVVLEFIARERIWRLSFNASTAKAGVAHGAWYIALSLLEHSPPAWLDSRLLIPAPRETKESDEGLFGPGKARPRPTLSMRIRTTEQLYARRGGHGNEIIAPLDGNEVTGGMGGLQYAGCPYIAPDETLHGRLEARLVKPEAECVIC